MISTGARIGRYQLDRLLGRGGMGQVWSAWLHGPHGFRRRSALKLVEAASVDTDTREVLIAEARLGAMVHHPNVAATLELGEDGGFWYIAMELVEGASVRALARAGALSPVSVVDVALQTARGLEHLHQAGLIHRDIKESNLVVDRYGAVKIVDLGVARLRHDSSGVAGTPGYMPAEQLRGDEDASADVFALGAALYRMVTGERPFGRRDTAARVVQDMPAALDAMHLDERVEPWVPGLAALIRRCLDGTPARRPSATDLVEALAALLPAQRGASLATAIAEVTRDAPPAADLDAGDPADALDAGGTVQGALPRPDGPLHGRAALLEHTLDQIRSGPITTLTGLGGIGKTRLALAAGDALEPTLEGGVCHVALAGRADPGGLRAAVAAAIGTAPGADYLDSALATLPRLLLLDGVEHLAADAAPILDLVAGASRARLLLTSRVPLGLPGEQVVVVPPLDEAASRALLLAHNPALEALPAPRLRPLLEALEGSPLAIELAAAQTRSRAVEDVLEAIRVRFDALVDPSRQDRHRSLRAALAGSWALLRPDEQDALAKLTVFARSFDARGARAVLDRDGAWVLDTLAFLVDCQLLQSDGHGRYTMRGSTAAFAAEHLRERAAAAARHRAYFAQLGHPDTLAALERRGGHSVLARLDAEHGNLRAAHAHAVESAAWTEAAQAGLAIAALRLVRGPVHEAIAALEAVVDVPLPPPLHARVTATLARACLLRDHTATAARHAALALDSAKRTGSDELLAAALIEVAAGRLARGQLRMAADGFRQAWRHARAARSSVLTARALEGLADAEHRRGRPDAARELYLRALQRHAAHGAAHTRAAAIVHLCRHLIEVGDLTRASELLEDAASVGARHGHRWVELRALGMQALIADYQGDVDRAVDAYGRAIHQARALGMRKDEAKNLLNLGSVHVVRGHTQRAERALQDARAVLRATGNPDDLDSIVLHWLARSALDRGLPSVAETRWRAVHRRREQLGEPRWRAAAAMGLAACALHAGAIADATGHLDDAHAHLGAADDPALAVQWHLHRAALARLQRNLPSAERRLGRAASVGVVHEQPWLAGLVHLERAWLRLATGAPDASVDAAERAGAALRQAGYLVQAALADAARATATARLGDPAGARRLLAAAGDVLRYLDATPRAPLRQALSIAQAAVEGARATRR